MAEQELLTETKPRAKLNFWCIVVLDEHGQDWIIRRSPDVITTEVLEEFAGEDNGMDNAWAKDQPPGVYRLKLSPWGSQNYEGEWDTGVDVTHAEQLFAIPNE